MARAVSEQYFRGGVKQLQLSYSGLRREKRERERERESSATVITRFVRSITASELPQQQSLQRYCTREPTLPGRSRGGEGVVSGGRKRAKTRQLGKSHTLAFTKTQQPKLSIHTSEPERERQENHWTLPVDIWQTCLRISGTACL